MGIIFSQCCSACKYEFRERREFTMIEKPPSGTIVCLPGKGPVVQRKPMYTTKQVDSEVLKGNLGEFKSLYFSGSNTALGRIKKTRMIVCPNCGCMFDPLIAEKIIEQK